MLRARLQLRDAEYADDIESVEQGHDKDDLPPPKLSNLRHKRFASYYRRGDILAKAPTASHPLSKRFTFVVACAICLSQLYGLLWQEQEPSPVKNQLEQDDFAVFYHIFVPFDAAGRTNALRIVEEQLKQVGESYAATLPHSVQLFYNTLGTPGIVNASFMEKFCGKLYNLECVHLNHFHEGTEEPTLSRVHDYCRQPESYGTSTQRSVFSGSSTATRKTQIGRRVIYIHNKGSFHVHRLNEHWRRLMTYAATSEHCLHPPGNSCNLCGLYFVAERGMFMAGNIWTAECNYISKLWAPMEFKKKSTSAIQESLLMLLQQKFDMDLYTFADFNFGVDRYSDEMWSASHPSILPCDLTGGKKYNFGFVRGTGFYRWVGSVWDPFQKSQTSLKWSMYPSLPLHLPLPLREDGRLASFVFDRSERIREFFLLGGNILKWERIYNEIPDPSSWIWDFFPDGDAWKKAVDLYGEHAADKLTFEHQVDSIRGPLSAVLQRLSNFISEILFVLGGLFFFS